MSQNNYQDGFPTEPLSAVNASYFLSENEKEEWKEWLKDASDEHKKELVETLHSMWIENESKKPSKQVVKDDKSEDKKEEVVEKPPVKKIQPTEKFESTDDITEEKKVKVVSKEIRDEKKTEESSQIKGQQKFFDISQIKVSQNQSAIDNIYQEFKNSRQNQEETLQKMMNSFVKFDKLETYFEVLAARTNDLNDSLVQLSKRVAGLESGTKNQSEDIKFNHQSLQDQMNELTSKIELSARDTRTLRKEVRENYEEFHTQLSASSVDIYKTDGLFEKVALLSSKLQKLEQGNVVKSTTAQNDATDSKKPDFHKENFKKIIKTQPNTLPRDAKKDTREWL